MSALGMDANGIVRTAYEFKDIFEKTGASAAPYCCPFCDVSYIDKCISTTCKKAPHFSLPKGVDHRDGCNGEGEEAPTPPVVVDDDQPKSTVVGDVEFPEALVAARRERGRFRQRGDLETPSRQEIEERRRRVDTTALISSKYTSSLLRTFVMAQRDLRQLARESALAYGQPKSPEYNAAYGRVMRSRRLELYGDPLTYDSAFHSSNLAPAASPRIYQGKGSVRRMGGEFVIEDSSTWPIAYKGSERLHFFVVTDAIPPAGSPRTHEESIAVLKEATASMAMVNWNAYGLAQVTADGEFVLRLETLDHLFLG